MVATLHVSGPVQPKNIGQVYGLTKHKIQMKTLIFLGFVLIITSSLYAQKTNTEAVEIADRQFDDSFVSKNIEAMFRPVAPNCLFLGTDPTERWDVASFRTMLENGLKNGMPPMEVTAREFVPSADGKTVVVIKKINWAIFKAPLREIALYENGPNGWQMKLLSLNLLIPNKKTKALNEVMAGN